jgi:hypothetical protein
MKTLKSLLYVNVAILFVGLSSCGSDGPGSMNKSEAQAAFESVGNSLSASFNEINEAPGTVGLNSFADLTSTVSPFATRISSQRPKEVREQVKITLASLRSMIVHPTAADGKFPGGEGFVFEENTGLYIYNSELGYFEREGNDAIIRIQYPTAGPESSDNDAEFRLAGYTETLVLDEYNPTFIDATLLIDGVTQASIDLTAEYFMETGEPKNVDLSVFVTPFTFDLLLNEKTTSTSVSESLSKAGVGVLIGFGVNVSYYSTDKSEENIKAISGYIQLMRIKFVASIVRENVQSPDDLKIAVKIDGKDAGDIVLVEDQFGDVEPNIKYNDGSLQPLEEVLGTLFAELEGLFPQDEEPM